MSNFEYFYILGDHGTLKGFAEMTSWDKKKLKSLTCWANHSPKHQTVTGIILSFHSQGGSECLNSPLVTTRSCQMWQHGCLIKSKHPLAISVISSQSIRLQKDCPLGNYVFGDSIGSLFFRGLPYRWQQGGEVTPPYFYSAAWFGL